MSRSSNQNQQQNQRCVEIDCMQFSHQDSFLTVGLRDETTPLMYAVNWRPTLTTVHRTRAEIHECEDISEKMDLSTDELSTGRRYLQSSSEYFTQLLDAKSSSLCVTVPVFTSTTPSPGRRMAALLLHSAQAWLSTDPVQVKSLLFNLHRGVGSLITCVVSCHPCNSYICQRYHLHQGLLSMAVLLILTLSHVFCPLQQPSLHHSLTFIKVKLGAVSRVTLPRHPQRRL